MRNFTQFKRGKKETRFFGWAEQDICPDCGGDLELVKKS